MEARGGRPQVQRQDEEAYQHQPYKADVLPGVHRPKRYLRVLPAEERQPELRDYVGVGWDDVEHREEGREAQSADGKLVQGGRRLHGEPEHQREEDPGLVAEHDRVERLRRALPDSLEVAVTDYRLQDEPREPPDEAPVSHPVVVFPIVLARAPEVPEGAPARDEEACVREVPHE